MKVAILLSRLDQTGMTTNTIDLCDALTEKGVTVDLIVGDFQDVPENLQYLKDRILNTKINVIGFTLNKSKTILNKLGNALGLLKVIFLLSFKKYDVIHVGSPYLSFLPWLIGKKFISTLHVPDLENIFAYKNATKVIAISKETHQYCIDKFNYKNEQIEIVYHGVSNRFSIPIDAASQLLLKNKYNIPNDNFIIGIVASIEKRKGHDLLIHAIEELPLEIRNKVSLIILGSYKSRASGWLEKLIDVSPIKNQIIWEQYTDPKPFYDIMDVFVLPSRLEGFGLVLIEAMLSDCLVVRSDTEGATEQIIHNETGYIFENNNYLQLSEILLKILSDDQLRKKIIVASKKYALENFTQDTMANNTLKVYHKLINKM